MSDVKPSRGIDPKGEVGSTKVPMFLLPPAAMAQLAAALNDGKRKYGAFNWRSTEVLASTYISAVKRHIDLWIDGEDVAEDSGIHHIAHAMAGLAILLDAMNAGSLVDDRPPALPTAELHKELQKVIR